MKAFRNSVHATRFVVLACSICFLWIDSRSNSLWAIVAIAAPTFIIMLISIGMLPKVMGHPKHRFDGGSNAEAIYSVMGPKKQWRPFNWASFALEIVGGVYMVFAGRGLTGIGVAFIVATLLRKLTNWLDTTRPGRGVAANLGLPVTPENELEIPLEYQTAD